MLNILLVEDNPSFQALVQQALTSLFQELVVVDTAKKAAEAARDRQIHLIILDMGLPDGDGLDLCARFQADERTREVPIIVLTGREEVSTKVAAFSIGAEDYIVKPFNPLEFRARIEAKLKKISRKCERDETLLRGELRINVSRQKCYRLVERKEQDLGLTAIEFRLLYQLARREEHVLSRDQILDQVWGEASEILDRTVDANISTLRRKLGNLSSYIRAVHGQGYSFSTSAGGAHI